MASTTSRSKYFDNAKFILIFLVVFGHMISPYKDQDKVLFTLYTVIFLFHMPAFILISGYFAKGFKNKGYLLKSVQKILIPYFIFQIIYSVVYFLVGKEKTLEFNLFQPHWSLWFLLSLFFWNLLLYVFAKLKWVGLLISVLLGIAIGYFEDAGSFMSISRTFVFFPYFLLGFLLNGDHLKRIIGAKYAVPAGVIIIIFTFLYFGSSFPENAVPWLLGDTSYENMGGMQLTDGLLRAWQYVLTLIVVFGFLPLIPSNQYRITKIGERTLYVYLFHGFIIKSIQSILPDAISENYLFLIVFSFMVCIVLGSYMIKKYTQPLVELKI
ncbi:acyltransferase family protein [Bacillus sp. EB106-08-02-XG196]|uniref:acyltransferase family protein n=1 Tax=Bacillus sp. EB106-08-02-XG196 TaxID=2737049 RepID=UPI0015C4A6ED|nr:acyltransferase family protein [Bacillus sp. EB106-08-02-XG196]NWQ42019.1 acyltransferase family protein [Bacillus sp. EB106-08-02-XG196]